MLIFNLIHKFFLSIHIFDTYLTYICFGPNYKTVVVASIQMFLAQQVFDMAYFRHYYYNDHLLSIIEVYNPEETYCYARPANVIINSNTGLKW